MDFPPETSGSPATSASDSGGASHVVAVFGGRSEIGVAIAERLAPNATTDRGVTQLTVTDASGTNFIAQSVETGQTEVTIYLPGGQTSTIAAVNTVNGSTVETRRVTTGGDRVI